MRFSPLVLAITLCCAGPMVEAAGLKFINIPADQQAAALQGAAWYPCAAPPGQVTMGRTVVPAVKDCPVTGTKLPLIVVSHGNLGWFGGHHDTAEALADAGFVVAAVTHPGDASSDPGRSVFERPADIKRLIDYMIATWPDHAVIDADHIGFFGFSRGGYTGLVVLGGNPDLRQAAALCRDGLKFSLCDQLREHGLPSSSPIHDSRIKAAVLADPGRRMLFSSTSLTSVNAPVQLWASERGGDGVTLELVDEIKNYLSAPPDYHLVHAGHFAFLAPCSPEQAAAMPTFCVDADGFDRVAFHREFNAAVTEFFQQHLR
jgi:predicted dienelactone hydrolase